MKRKSFLQLLALSLMLSPVAFADGPGGRPGDRRAGAVFTMSNDVAGNRVIAWHRAEGGTLSPWGEFPTGGIGSGGGLGNQGGLLLSPDNDWLFACNAGSHDISVFRVRPTGLELTDRVPSGGFRPISLTLHRHLLYVLNAGGGAGGSDNITGFLFFGGHLWHGASSTRPLSAGNTAPAQISFTPDGDVLVVTEKATSIIDTYTVGANGLPDHHQMFNSIGQTPFGFAVRGHRIFVSEAFGGAPNASAVSSYEVEDNGNLTVISPSVGTTETAACWVVITENGRYAYASNTGSSTLSGYRVQPDGTLSLLNADGVTAPTDAGPIDLALSRNSRHLYSLNRTAGTVTAYAVENGTGALTPIPGVSGIPTSANGLVAY